MTAPWSGGTLVPGETRAGFLDRRHFYGQELDLLDRMIHRDFTGRIAVSSSFGTESAVLLDMVAAVDPTVPVIFANTGLLFPETRAYRDRLSAILGLRDVRTVTPDPENLVAEDPDGTLHRTCADRCCQLRKVEPFDLALEGFDAWITGRKAFHGGLRSGLPEVEEDVDGRVKVNPLAGWSAERIESAYLLRGLPRHPLAEEGFTSVGCAPCTRKGRAGKGVRAGRWAGTAKTECGLHLPRMPKGA